MTTAERIERIITGVIRQAMRDAGASTVSVAGTSGEAELLRAWCQRSLGQAAVARNGLTLDSASKTALLLGEIPQAAVLPFGDLYYSQVVMLAGRAELPVSVQQLADACDGTNRLDECLERFFDQRMPWAQASLQLSAAARDLLQQRLSAARFQRAHVPLVPKLGARTLGIDLYA